MIVEQLIEELQKMPPGTNVCIFDWRKSLANDPGDGTSGNGEGIYSDFYIEMMELGPDEAEFHKEINDTEYVAWLAIGFENDDYTEEGEKVEQ